VAALMQREVRAPLRVLLVAAATGTSGGGERHVADLIEALPARGIEVALACPAGGDLGRLAHDRGVRHFEAPIAAGFSSSQLRALHASIVAAPWNVVHAHGSRAAAFARAADPHGRRRIVYHVHGIHVDRAGRVARRTALLAVERTLRPNTARFITVCHADAVRGARLGLVSPSRTITIHNGIASPPVPAPSGRFRRELHVSDGVPLVLNVGRFHEQKDQTTLLKAWRSVAAAHPEAVLALVGSGPLGLELRSQAAAAGIAGSVRFAEPRASLLDAYADADVFALSSRWEGLPYVLLEAMAHGLPVISTAVDGVPEVVTGGVTGLLVPPSDAGALGRALIGLLDDPARRLSLGAEAQGRVAADFALDRMIDGVLAVYRGLARLSRAGA